MLRCMIRSVFFFSSRRRHTRYWRDWSSDVCSSDLGWTAYAPLSTEAPMGQLFFTIGVQFAGASSIATALNFLVTIITMRAPGMTFWRMPLLVWANFSTSLLVVIATPFIAASQFFVLLDYGLGFNFFVPEDRKSVV